MPFLVRHCAIISADTLYSPFVLGVNTRRIRPSMPLPAEHPYLHHLSLQAYEELVGWASQEAKPWKENETLQKLENDQTKIYLEDHWVAHAILNSLSTKIKSLQKPAMKYPKQLEVYQRNDC